MTLVNAIKEEHLKQIAPHSDSLLSQDDPYPGHSLIGERTYDIFEPLNFPKLKYKNKNSTTHVRCPQRKIFLKNVPG